MSGTGYVSIGHLFEESKHQTQVACSRHFHRLVERICVDLNDYTVRNVNSLVLFDKFFSNVEVSVDSSQAFLSGILRGHDVDELLFQLKVERTVWKMLGSYPDFHDMCNKYEMNTNMKYEEIRI